MSVSFDVDLTEKWYQKHSLDFFFSFKMAEKVLHKSIQIQSFDSSELATSSKGQKNAT